MLACVAISMRDPQAEIMSVEPASKRRQGSNAAASPAASRSCIWVASGGDDAGFPLHIADAEGVFQRVALEQQTKLGHPRSRLGEARDLEAALALGDDQSFRDEAAQALAQGAEADAVGFAQSVQRELAAGREDPAQDIGADAAEGAFARRLAHRPPLIARVGAAAA